MATTRAERIFTAGAEAPRRRALAPVAPLPREGGRAASADTWALVRDAAGGLLVLGSWAALWTWFLAATL